MRKNWDKSFKRSVWKRVSGLSKGVSSDPDLPTEDQHHVRVSAMSRHPKSTGMGICRVLCGDVYTSKKSRDQDLQLGEVACTSRENWDELQEAEKERDWLKLSALPKRIGTRSLDRDELDLKRGENGVFESNFSTHFSLLFLTKWFRNSMAESWSSRETVSWRRHQAKSWDW